MNALVFDRSMLEREMKTASIHLSAILQKVGDEQLSKLPKAELDLPAQIRRLLDEGFNTGHDRTMADAAKLLGMSQRTLQRRLRESGHSFQELREQTRQELACGWLRQPQMAIGEVAYLLGFSEPSAFHRAFKRWTGKTPAQFRAT
jgi:AraC-like DNA-binding protein